MLDEEEPTLIEYICKKLCDHSSPQDILDQLQVVLDDEASAFVIKMWRMLIFNMLNV
uniref:PWI domain-containing protein n=1 Tax=Arcella intermedia TaxID=1963864 RepID=A0A6B2LW90_9EUKA